MGATYTRQSSYSDGDTITAAHTNDEFNQLLATFAASTGHTHDGTTAEGGPITKLLGTAITIGDGTAGTDIAVTFDGETSDGVLNGKKTRIILNLVMTYLLLLQRSYNSEIQLYTSIQVRMDN